MKKLPKPILAVCISLFSIFLYAQGDYIVIGDTAQAIHKLTFDEVTLNSGDNGYVSKEIHLDEDGDWDLKFSVGFGSGWWGGSGGIDLYASDDTYILKDTNAIQMIGPCNDTYPDTVSQVMILNPGDSIHIKKPFSTAIPITKIDVWSGPCIIDDWLMDWADEEDHYIGFHKIINNQNYLGWIKVNVESEYSITIKEIAINLIYPEYHLQINEYMFMNTATIADENGAFVPWIEIYNPSDLPVFLNDYSLKVQGSDSAAWDLPHDFILPKEHLIIWADNSPHLGEFHANFTLSMFSELSLYNEERIEITTIEITGFFADDISYGINQYENGSEWVTLYDPSPGVINIEESHLTINEFMALNHMTISDEYGEYDDWFEVYNADTLPVYLGNKYATDNAWWQNQWKFPQMVLGPGEFLLIWADNNPDQGPLHASFKLDDDGEFVGIFQNYELRSIDGYDFSSQEADISEGRALDGGLPWRKFPIPTPGATNEFVGVDEFQQTIPLEAFPNPSKDGNVHLNEPIDGALYDGDGRLILRINNSTLIHTEHLGSGTYYIKSRDGRIVKLIIL